MSEPIDLSPLRASFPALQRCDAQGRQVIFLDGPGGTQVPQIVIDAIAAYLRESNANTHGAFATSAETDGIIASAREAMADFLNAHRPEEIAFGANMTTLTFNVSRAIGRELAQGDELIVTRLDHDANISPWLSLEEKGVVVKIIDFNPEDCTLKMEEFDQALTERVKVVAVGYASNAVGTINPVKDIVTRAHAVGALVYVDAVQYAPHGPIDVQEMDCDFLVCSAYKFFGPHIGVLYGKYDVLERLQVYKVRPADDRPPYKFETGTLNHEGIAGCRAAVEYLAQIGAAYGRGSDGSLQHEPIRRKRLKQAMATIQRYERGLAEHLLAGLQAIPGVRLYGITASHRLDWRVPTFAIRHNRLPPAEIARLLGQQGIFVWDGNFYALAVTRRLGVEDNGGLLRIGPVHYNTPEEIDRLLNALDAVLVS